MEKIDFFKNLSEKSKKIGIEIKENQLEKFYQYMNHLLEWNEKVNLTAIIDPNDIILKHFIDSITINKYIKGKENVIDIGTGAGFPGIPLKILNSDTNFTLVDSLNKRITFLNTVKEKLNLEKIECIHGRVEEIGRDNKYREKFDIITSRAVAKLNILIEYMLPLLDTGGHCICMKGPDIDQELNEASKAIKLLGGEIEKVEKITLPDSDNERNIIVIRKVKNTPEQYPRKPGTPTKTPII